MFIACMVMGIILPTMSIPVPVPVILIPVIPLVAVKAGV